MPTEMPRIDLSCPECAWRQSCGPQGMADWVRTTGMLRRNQRPSPAELVELLRAAAARLACPQCGQTGLVACAAADDAQDWPGARTCEACGRPIPAERLEALPNARLCTACQRGDDRGDPPSQVDYCPRCGSPMTIRQSRSTGITRYVAVCSAGCK